MSRGPKRATTSAAESTLGDRLDAARAGSEAAVVLLLDEAGSVIAASQEAPDLDPVVFGPLACAHAAASLNLATLVGGVEFRALVQQGTDTTILLSKAADRVLASVHAGILPPAQITPQAEMSVARLRELMQAGEPGLGVEGGPPDPEWRRLADSQIDRIFGEGA